MKQQEMLAMILAGGRGTRLGALTDKVAKPAVSFGGKYRIVDFPLSNCANSGIEVVGVLTQYESIFLNAYVAQDQRWGLDARDSGIYVLPPREKEEGFGLYEGTADAIRQNIDFIDMASPEYVLILSGDHVYKMDYSWMLKEHKKTKAQATIAVIDVSIEEAKRYGIMNCDRYGRILEFEEKPEKPKSTLASMGIYIFNWKVLRRILKKDSKNKKSSHDFGKDIIPAMLKDGHELRTYKFGGYWMDVGTLDSLWKANMDLLDSKSGINIRDKGWKIYTEDRALPPHFVSTTGAVSGSLINQGTIINGLVEDSVIFDGVKIDEGAVVKNSVVFSNAHIKKGAEINKAIVMESVVVNQGKYNAGKDGSVQLIQNKTKGR